MSEIKLACIIDDDPIYLFAIKKMFKIINFSKEYIFYENGLEAINGLITIIEKGESLPDVILLDINMPIMDGWVFLEEYRATKIKNKIPIYITSSSVNNIDIERAKESDLVNGYINKPIKKNSLIKIKTLLNK